MPTSNLPHGSSFLFLPRRRKGAPAPPSRPLTRTIRGEMTESARLDEELLNTHVDPVVLKRTVRQSATRSRRSPPPHPQGGDDRRFVPTRTLLEGDAAYYDRRVRMGASKGGS